MQALDITERDDAIVHADDDGAVFRDGPRFLLLDGTGWLRPVTRAHAERWVRERTGVSIAELEADGADEATPDLFAGTEALL